MNMQNLKGKRVLITGGSQGLGLAMVEALAACGANVTAMSRDRANLAAAGQAGAAVIAGDATDATLMNKAVREEAPDVLILNAGARLPIKPIDQQNWDEFSTVWNTDVKAGLAGIQAALHTPMKPGGRVLVMSSGAAMVLAVPFIAPEDLSLSGGYIGAKRMLWFMAHSANAVSRESYPHSIPHRGLSKVDHRLCRPTVRMKRAWSSTLPSDQLCLGAPRSHQRTWVNQDGAKPHQRSIFFSFAVTTDDRVPHPSRSWRRVG